MSFTAFRKDEVNKKKFEITRKNIIKENWKSRFSIGRNTLKARIIVERHVSILHVSEDRSASKRKHTSDTVVCTACYQRLDAYRIDWLKKHPILGVLICKRCLMKHEVPIQRGDDGMDEACRWCALEGDLICCDFCHNVFCNECIRRNLGRKHLSIILNAGPEQKWQCYVCNPEPIQGLMNMCEMTLKNADVSTEDLDDDFGEDEDDNLGVDEDDDDDVENPVPKKRKYTKRQPKIIPIEELTYEALIEKKGAKNNDQKTKIEEGTEKVVETEEKEGDKKEDKEFLYISTSDGKVVAMNRSDVVKVEMPPSFKRPKGRPRLNNKPVTSTPVVKKVAQSGDTHKNSSITLEALAGVKLHEKVPHLESGNAWNVVEKLTASIQSMYMLLSSLKDDLVRTEVLFSKEDGLKNPVLKRKKKVLAANFWRAYLAYKKSFVDIEAYSHSPQSIVSVDGKLPSNIQGQRIEDDESTDDKTNGFQAVSTEEARSEIEAQPQEQE